MGDMVTMMVYILYAAFGLFLVLLGFITYKMIKASKENQ